MKRKKAPSGQVGGYSLGVGVSSVASLLDQMVDGRELGSIAGLRPDPQRLNVLGELRRALSDIEAVRGRPCLAYLGNMVKREVVDTGITHSDNLAFEEMVRAIDPAATGVDVLLVTPGGIAQQVQKFVDTLRARFPDSVEFLLPDRAYSSGTLWALSGDRIWMLESANMGPIDPQVQTKEGRFVSAEAIRILVDVVGRDGMEALKATGQVPWHLVRLIDGIDKRDLADAMLKSQYCIDMATAYLAKYKFRLWTTDATTGNAITDEVRLARAKQIARELASTARWKDHGHAINRDVAWSELRIKIDHPDPVLTRVLRRAWALSHWIFENTNTMKVIMSQNYDLVRIAQTEVRLVQG